MSVYLRSVGRVMDEDGDGEGEGEREREREQRILQTQIAWLFLIAMENCIS